MWQVLLSLSFVKDYKSIHLLLQPTKRWDIYLKWVDWLLTEYYQQGDMERARGLDVTPMLDREHPIPMPNFQMGFLKAIVNPLFEELGRVPGVDVSTPLKTLHVREC